MRVCIALLLLASTAFAQRGGGGMRGGGFRGGGFGGPGIVRGGGSFGHIGVRPGFGHRGFVRPGFRGGFGFARRGFGFGAGFGGGFFAPRPFYRSYAGFGGFFGGFGGVFPVAPVVAGGWYAEPYIAPPPVIVIPAPPPATSEGPVIIHNTPVGSWRDRDYRVEREYYRRGAERDESAPIVYLIALKDGRLWAAVAYWVDGSTLHIVTRSREKMEFPLDQVDREFSIDLNGERGVQFRLP